MFQLTLDQYRKTGYLISKYCIMLASAMNEFIACYIKQAESLLRHPSLVRFSALFMADTDFNRWRSGVEKSVR